MVNKIYEDGVVYYTIVKKDDVLGDSDTKKARCVLEWMLSYFGIDCPEIRVSRYGKPYFEDLDMYFNYSHSRSYIACALSNYDVGIDIEDSDRKISDNVSKKYLDGEEDSRKRLVKWVQKEAYSKLIGLGILVIRDIKLDNICSKSVVMCNERYVCCVVSECGEFKEIELVKTNTKG